VVPSPSALLAALCLPCAAAQSGDHATAEAIHAAIDRGVDFLIATQELDGSWRYKQDEYACGQTALCLYALVKSGIPRDHPAVRRAEIWLDNFVPQKTYSTACLLMALEALDPARHAERIRELADQLVDWQRTGFGYPSFAEPDPDRALDLSNTQYGALGLRAAARAGVEVPTKVWTRLADYVMELQTETGGFRYRPDGKPTGSMTAAGVGTLAIVRNQLHETRRLKPAGEKAFEASIQAGLEWLAKHFDVANNPAPDADSLPNRWLPYYLYGLERVGALVPTDTIGPHDWYQAGADHLVAAQHRQGSWGNVHGELEPSTCFALLFLERATATTGESKGRGRRTYGAPAAGKDVSLVAAGDTPISVWIARFGDDAIAAYEWPDDAGRGPRVARVEYMADGEVFAVALGSAGRPSAGERYSVQMRFEEPGAHELRARVFVCTPKGASGGTQVLESEPLSITITELYTEWMEEYARAPSENLLPHAARAASASTTAAEGGAPALVLDNLQSTSWVAAGDDPEPWIAVELQKPERADHLILSHARGAVHDPLRFDRATKVRVLVNDREPFEAELDPREQRKTAIPLPPASGVRRLEVRVLERLPGRSRPGEVGFAELELVLRGAKR